MNLSDNDLLVQSRFKNLRLYELMDGKTNAEVARAVGISQTTFGRLLNLIDSPFSIDTGTEERSYRVSAQKIAMHFNVSPEYLFPSTLYTLVLPQVVDRRYSSIELMPLLSANGIPSLIGNPERALEIRELGDTIETQLETLNPRDARVLRLRTGLEDGREYTLEEVGEMLHISKERVRTIETRGLKCLRHPSRAKYLVASLDKEEAEKYITSHPLTQIRSDH